jgi:hypothetical protein
MKLLITNYTFNAAAKTVTFTDYTTIALENVLLVTNVTDGIVIYQFNVPTKGGTVATNVLTLEHDTTSMDNLDDIQIYYDDASYDIIQYKEDVAAPADPSGIATSLVRQDTPATLVSTNGDNVARRGTNYGAAYTQIVTSAGAFVDTFGGGTQYTEGDVDATITGTAAMMEVAANTLQPVQGTVADGLLVNLGGNNDVTVTSVPAPLSTTGGGTEATAHRVTIANDSTGLVSVDDNGGSFTVDAPIGTPVNAQISDGTRTATVRDTGTSDSLNVAIVDASGNQITAFSGGTEYTEDVAAPADPVGGTNLIKRRDTPGALVSTDGDWVAQHGSNYGAAFSTLLKLDGTEPAFGAGTQYTEGDIDATITGTALLVEGPANTLYPVQITGAGGGVKIDITSVSGTGVGTSVPVNDNATTLSVDDGAGALTVDNAGTFAVQVDGAALTSLQLIDDTIATDGSASPTKGVMLAGTDGTNAQTVKVDTAGELQIDILTLPALIAGTANIGDVDVLTLPALVTGDNTVGRVKLTDGTDVADVLDLTNSNPLTVAIVDGAGTQITSFGGGVQYTEGDVDATITGTAVMFESGGNTLAVAGSVNPLPINLLLADGTAVLNGAGGLVVDLGANNDVTVTSGAITETNSAAIKTAVELIDDTVKVLGTDTYTEATTKGLVAGAIRRDADTTAVGTDNEIGPLQMDANGRLKVEAFSGETLPITVKDSVGDSAMDDANNALRVNVVAGAAGGTEYTTNAVAPADPLGPTLLAERDDQLATLAEVEGDWTNARATSKGAIWVALADSAGDPITSFGGGVQYTQGDVDTTITGTAMIGEGPSNTMTPVQMTAADGNLKVDITSIGNGTSVGATIPVSGTVTANAGSGNFTAAQATAANLNMTEASAAAILTSVQLIDDTVYTDGAGTVVKGLAILGQDGTNPQAIKTDTAGELQIDVLTLPALVAGSANIGDVDVLTVPAPLSTSGNGTAATALRVTVANDSTGQVALAAGSQVIGSLTADQTINLRQVASANVITAATGVQKVGVVGNTGASFDSLVGIGTAPTNAVVGGHIFNTAAPIPTSGQSMARQADQAGNARITPGIATATLSVWNSSTSVNATQNIFTNSGVEGSLVHLVQSAGTFTAGAITFEITYDSTNWITIPADCVIDPASTSMGTVSLPYTLITATNKPFALLHRGAQGLRLKLSTAITGTGTVTPNYALLSFAAAKKGYQQLTDGTTAVGVIASTTALKADVSSVAGTATSVNNGAVGNGVQRVTIANDSTGILAAVTSLTQMNGQAISMNTGVRAAGTQRVTIATDDLVPVSQATASNLNAQVVGNIAHDTAISGNPVRLGLTAETSPKGITPVADGDVTNAFADSDGILMVKLNTSGADLISERVSDTAGTSTALTNFSAVASTFNYVTAITVFRTDAGTTPAFVDFRDGAAGSVKWSMPLPPNGGSTVASATPLFKTTANTAVAYDVSAALTTVYISISGFQSKV